MLRERSPLATRPTVPKWSGPCFSGLRREERRSLNPILFGLCLCCESPNFRVSYQCAYPYKLKLCSYLIPVLYADCFSLSLVTFLVRGFALSSLVFASTLQHGHHLCCSRGYRRKGSPPRSSRFHRRQADPQRTGKFRNSAHESGAMSTNCDAIRLHLDVHRRSLLPAASSSTLLVHSSVPR